MDWVNCYRNNIKGKRKMWKEIQVLKNIKYITSRIRASLNSSKINLRNKEYIKKFRTIEKGSPVEKRILIIIINKEYFKKFRN